MTDFLNNPNEVSSGMNAVTGSIPEGPSGVTGSGGVNPEVTSALDFGDEETRARIQEIIDTVDKVTGMSQDAKDLDERNAAEVDALGGPVTELSSSSSPSSGVPMQAMSAMPSMAQMPMQAMSSMPTMAQMPMQAMQSAFGGSGYGSPSSTGTYSASSRYGAGSSGSSRAVPKGALPRGVANEHGLQRRTILAARAISAAFPEIREIGGYRKDALHWHPNGLAIDVMIPNHDTPQGRALGDRVMKFVLENGERLGLDNAIWRQRLYNEDGSSSRMNNLGNPTANHMDHVHIATTGGGYPKGRQQYVF